MPVFLECQRCTACCRWPGQVRLSDSEIKAISAYKGLSEFEFIQTYTRLASDRRGLALMDAQGGSCVFLEGENCSVQPVKPRQCRDFPNLWSHPDAHKHCRAKPLEVSPEEWIRRVQLATGRPELTVADIPLD